MKSYQYLTNCVESTAASIDKMVDAAKEITFETFARNCDYTGLARSMGYSVGPEKGLHIKDDYAVRFYSSKFKGKKCYYIVRSAIEWIFTA